VDLSAGSVTSTSLLARLQQTPSDQVQVAWTEFVERNGRRIHGWCRQWGLQEADAQDVTQTVRLKLLRAVQTFRYGAVEGPRWPGRGGLQVAS
jgi:DNA-directed RNA polymerase specialized sigma24 family protein